MDEVMSIAIEQLHESEVNPYFSDNYRQARERFLESVKNNVNFSFHEELKLDAKGADGKDLFIDIVWVGPVDAEKILIHLSATHGVEGHIGAAGQLSIVEDSIPMPEKTACIFIFGMNSFGYSWNRRVNENNIDLNRNLRDNRESPELYPQIDPFMNPKHIMTVKEFQEQFSQAKEKYDWLSIKNALASGQYDYPEGLFYGGTKVEQGPELVLAWFESQFSNRVNGEDLRFLIVDVHSGLGEERGMHTLLTPKKPSQSIIEHFGTAMQIKVQSETMDGYRPLGMFTITLAKRIEVITNCTLPILRICEEFGTVPIDQVMMALWAENMHWHHSIRENNSPDHECDASLLLKKVFCLDDKLSQDKAVSLMREMFVSSIDYLQIAPTLIDV